MSDIKTHAPDGRPINMNGGYCTTLPQFVLVHHFNTYWITMYHGLNCGGPMPVSETVICAFHVRAKGTPPTQSFNNRPL